MTEETDLQQNINMIFDDGCSESSFAVPEKGLIDREGQRLILRGESGTIYDFYIDVGFVARQRHKNSAPA